MYDFAAVFQRFFRYDAPRRTVIEIFSEDADILVDLAHLKKQSSKVGPETALQCAACYLGDAEC